MPIEMISDALTSYGGAQGNTSSKPDQVSVWAVQEGPTDGGYPSSAQLVNQGLPFGNGESKTVKGFVQGTVTENGKTKPNIAHGPGGRKLVEMVVDRASMEERDRSFQRQASRMEGKGKSDATAGSGIDGIGLNASINESTFRDGEGLQNRVMDERLKNL